MRPSKPGRSRTPLTQQPTEAGRRSIDASEIMRRAGIEGRDPYSALGSAGIEVPRVQKPREFTSLRQVVTESEEPKVRLASPQKWLKQQEQRRGLS